MPPLVGTHLFLFFLSFCFVLFCFAVGSRPPVSFPASMLWFFQILTTRLKNLEVNWTVLGKWGTNHAVFIGLLVLHNALEFSVFFFFMKKKGLTY